MRRINELLPTEALLLLDIRKTTGLRLIIKTIEELIFIEVITIDNYDFEGRTFQIIKEKDFTNKLLKDYHDLFILSIQEHYNAYKKITIQNALTPDKLVGYVRVKLNFSYNRYKFGLIYSRLELWQLVRSRFPFYYLNKSLTKKGMEMKIELINQLEEIKKEIATGRARKKINEIRSKIGLNILLIPEILKHDLQIKTNNPKHFDGLEGNLHNSILHWHILDSANINMFESESPDLPDLD